MPEYHLSIDDGSALASSACEQFKDMDTAMSAALAAALRIAAEEFGGSGQQTFACEIQDVLTREIRRSTVVVKVEHEPR